MIIKVRPTTRGFQGLVGYVLGKPREPPPTLIDTNMAGRSPDDFALQMDTVTAMKPPPTGEVWHTIVSWHPTDRVSEAQMRETASRLFEKLGIDAQKHQYLVVRHEDEDHPHLHVIVNRVGLDGSLYLNQLSGKKADQLRVDMEREHGWVVAEGRGAPGHEIDDQKSIHREERLGLKQAKHIVHTAVRDAIGRSDGSFEGFVEECRRAGTILPNLSFNDRGFNGASFGLLSATRPGEIETDEQGEPFFFKGSQIAWNKDRFERALLERRQAIALQQGGHADMPDYADILAVRGDREGGSAVTGGSTSPRSPAAAQRPPRGSRAGRRSIGGPRRSAFQRILSARPGTRRFSIGKPWANLQKVARMLDQTWRTDIDAASLHRKRFRGPSRGR